MENADKRSSRAEDFIIITQIRLFGDTAAFGSLVKKYQSPLRRYLYNLTDGNSSLSDDISQEAFIKAFKNIKSFSGIGSFKGWLFKIAYCQFIDTTRTFRYNADVSQAEAVYASMESNNQILTETVSVLNEVERNLIILSCIEDCSHSEIAKITSMPLGTVKTNIARAKEKLRKHLSEDGKIL